MIKPEIPQNETSRLTSLCALNVLDTPAEERFDRFTRIAQRHFGVSITLVSLVDAERQWFKSRQGLDAPETPRDISFCGHAILKNGIFYIPDTLEDPRFADNPLVTGPPNIRFYAGAPLRAPDGQRIGTLCIIDDKPREFTDEELVILRDLADGVEEELRHSSRERASIQRRIHPMTVIGLAAGGLLSLVLFLLVSQIEKDNIRLELRKVADERAAALLVEMASLKDVMQGIDGLYIVSSDVSGDEFADFISRAFPLKTEIHSAVWIEHRQHGGMEALRQMAKKDGYSDFRLHELDVNGQLVDAGPRPENAVIYHVYNPHQESWFPRGLNLSALPGYGTLLEQAAASGKPVTTRQHSHTEHEHHNGKTIELFMPVYYQERSPAGVAPAGRVLRGFVGLLIDVASSVEAAYQHRVPTAAGLDFYVLDADTRRSEERLYFHASRARSSVVGPLPLEEIELGNHVSINMEFLDTRWRIVLRPIPGRYETGKTAGPWLALGVGLLFTLMVAGYINSMQRRRIIVEEQVRQRTAELNNSRERTRAVIDTVVDGIVTINAQGLVQTFNPAAEQIFGYSAEQVIDHNVKMLMPASYADEHDGYLHNYLTTGEKKVIGLGREVTGQRSDGSTFAMELAVSEMYINGERMFTGIVRDITERKRLDRMKSEFVSTVSHELRTPLTAIRGSLGLVLGKAADKLPDKVRKMLEVASRNSDRLTLLINDLLDLEKIESGRMEFEFSTVDLVALARQAIADNEAYAQQHQVRLKLVSTLEHAPVRGDEHRLLQVFANLISNAVKYSPQDGEVEIGVDAHDGNWRVSVRDRGQGIPEEFRSRIFQRFAQADSSDTREKGGTGLGLSITRAIVEFLEGQIDYESEPGKGTVFYFDLPAWRATIENEQGGDTVTGKRVLICEDNVDVASILAEMLKQEGLLADIATTAGAARTLLGKNAYRLLLLDLTLPDMDGLQFLQELRAAPATVELPVIVVSGRAEEGRMAFKGDAVTVVDWLQKPIDGARLERALREALRSTVRPHILHVEDDPDIVQVTKVLLEDMADISHVPSLSEARQQLATQSFDLAILDLGLADGSGLDLLDELKGHCPVVIFSAQVPGREISAQVNAALTKSMTSNEQLLATIRKVLEG